MNICRVWKDEVALQPAVQEDPQARRAVDNAWLWYYGAHHKLFLTSIFI